MVVTGEEDYVKRIINVVHTVERVASPGEYLVDTLPSLMYLPTSLPHSNEKESGFTHKS
jgi:hypothetical protein